MRALAERVLPQEVEEIDLAVPVDKRLALGTGKSWRYAVLPGDLEAYRCGLAGLDATSNARHGRCFSELNQWQKDAVLTSIVSSDYMTGLTGSEETRSVGVFTGTQMVRWFKNVRNERRRSVHAERTMLAAWEEAGAEDCWVLQRSAHTIGTCRMAESASKGVVDRSGRSFDVPNLWICDNSVFPSALPANPRLTIMAISLRTADAFLEERGG